MDIVRCGDCETVVADMDALAEHAWDCPGLAVIGIPITRRESTIREFSFPSEWAAEPEWVRRAKDSNLPLKEFTR